MKKQLTLALGLAVLATPAFASKARLLALGEDANGSFFINDNRNIFLNAAEANNHGDLVTFEFGDNNGTDSDTDANAEGGILYANKNFVYGIHMGSSTGFERMLGSLSLPAATQANGIYKPNTTVDLFLAGDAGFKWGANLSYSRANNDTFGGNTAGTVSSQKSDSNSMDLNVGATFGNLSVYVDSTLVGEMTMKQGTAGATPKTTLDSKGRYELGASYKLNNYTVFAQAAMSDFEAKVGGAKTDIESKFYTIGAARTERLSDKTMMFVKLYASQLDTKGFSTTGAILNKNDIKTTRVPVAVGFEHDATSWLVLRGSVAQNLWSQQDDDATKKRTLANSTSVNAGATLKLGDFNVDGLIGTGNDGAGNLAARDQQAGVLSMDNLMTRVSMTYRF